VRVLVADDDATSRLMVTAMVAKSGHECVDAADGSSAWRRLVSGDIDVLLTDWMMPGMDGPELCRQVREELGDHYVYIVLITGLGNPGQVLEGMGAGADDYLVKPVDPFSVQTRLVAAERVTGLHRQLRDVRRQLERANLELLGRSLTDPLTGLGNRRRLDEDLARVHADAARDGTSYSVVLFDIDHFKLFNDRYGHPAGDQTLRRVGQCLESETRRGQDSYRYGGEEFLVLLQRCDLDAATQVAERIGRAVAACSIPHTARPTPPPVVTVSGGVACRRPDSGSSSSDLISQADHALFEAKSAGRNCVRAFDRGDVVVASTAFRRDS
jgi:two-component system chemotaxis response regulator CheY